MTQFLDKSKFTFESLPIDIKAIQLITSGDSDFVFTDLSLACNIFYDGIKLGTIGIKSDLATSQKFGRTLCAVDGTCDDLPCKYVIDYNRFGEVASVDFVDEVASNDNLLVEVIEDCYWDLLDELSKANITSNTGDFIYDVHWVDSVGHAYVSKNLCWADVQQARQDSEQVKTAKTPLGRVGRVIIKIEVLDQLDDFLKTQNPKAFWLNALNRPYAVCPEVCCEVFDCGFLMIGENLIKISELVEQLEDRDFI